MDIYEIKDLYDNGYMDGIVIYVGVANFNITSSDYRFGVTVSSKKIIQSRTENKKFMVVKFFHALNNDKIIIFTEDDKAVYNSKAAVGDSVRLTVNVSITADLDIRSRKDDSKFMDRSQLKIKRDKFKNSTKNMTGTQINEYAAKVMEKERYRREKQWKEEYIKNLPNDILKSDAGPDGILWYDGVPFSTKINKKE